MNKYFLLTFSVFCSFSALASLSMSVPYRPAGPDSGYVGTINFSYEMKNCFNDLHVAIVLQRSMTSSEYIYKGKSYSPSDLQMPNFASAKVGLVSELSADVLDRGQKIGRVVMSTVIDKAGSGCYGQSYSVKKSIGNLDAQEASQRPNDFSLSSGAVKASARDYEVEAKIESLIRAQTNAEKNASPGGGDSQAEKKPEEPQKVDGKTVSQSDSSTQNNPTSVEKQTNTQAQTVRQSVDINKMNQETQQRVESADRAGREFGEKAGQAAGHLGTAAMGMWEDGHGMGFGLMAQDEDASFYLNLSLGLWDVWEGGAPSSFWAGMFTYLGVDLLADRPLEGAPLSQGADKFTRAVLAFDFLNNSWASDGWRLVYGPTLNFVDTFLPMGVKDKELELEFGLDLGLAFVNKGGLVALTYNLQSEVYGIQLIFKKAD